MIKFDKFRQKFLSFLRKFNQYSIIKFEIHLISCINFLLNFDLSDLSVRRGFQRDKIKSLGMELLFSFAICKLDMRIFCAMNNIYLICFTSILISFLSISQLSFINVSYPKIYKIFFHGIKPCQDPICVTKMSIVKLLFFDDNLIEKYRSRI